MKLTTVGIDLAKQVFQFHGIDEHGKVLVKKQLRRERCRRSAVLPKTGSGCKHLQPVAQEALKPGQRD
jgi:transposase